MEKYKESLQENAKLRKEKVYLASSMSEKFRDTIIKAAEILRKTFEDVYVPMENYILMHGIIQIKNGV